MSFEYLDPMAHNCRLKLHFHLYSDIPKKSCSSKKISVRVIETHSGWGSSSSSPVWSSDCSKLPNSLPNYEWKSMTRLRLDNICGPRSRTLSVCCRHSSDHNKNEKGDPSPFHLTKDNFSPSYLVRDNLVHRVPGVATCTLNPKSATQYGQRDFPIDNVLHDGKGD